MAIDLEIWWIRLLSFAACLPMFGPHLYAMGKMVINMIVSIFY